MKTGCVLMAAGVSNRFGPSDKLHTEFEGTALYVRAMELARGSADAIVTVTRASEEDILTAALNHGFLTAVNPRPEDGISLSIAIGTRALMDCDAIMYMVCDQPRLKRSSIDRLWREYMKQPQCIVALAWESKRGNPVIFPAKYYRDLCSLSGDTGGSAVIKAHADKLITVQARDRAELFDVDTQNDIKMIMES